MHKMLFWFGSMFLFYCVCFLFPLCSSFDSPSLFLTVTIVPVSFCHLSHAGMWNKLLNCSAVLSRQHPLPLTRLLIFAFLIYVLSSEDKKGHRAPHSADKWSVEIVRGDTKGSPHYYTRDVSICLGSKPVSSLFFVGPKFTGADECPYTNKIAKDLLRISSKCQSRF